MFGHSGMPIGNLCPNFQNGTLLNGLAVSRGGAKQGVPYPRPQERSRQGAAPKEQPPRKLSGERTAGGRALWKAAGGSVIRALTEGVSRTRIGRFGRGR